MLIGEKRYHKLYPESALTPMYWNIFLRNLGGSMVGLFIPLFIFFIGKDSGGTIRGLQLVAIYMLMERLLVSAGVILVTRIIERIGYGLSIFLGSLMLVVYYCVPVFYGQRMESILLMVILVMPATLFYWISRLTLLSIDGNKREYGQEVGFIRLLENGAGILAPFVGGVIWQWWGYQVLFGIGAIIILFSSVPLFFLKQVVVKDGVSWKGYKSWVRNSDNSHLVVSFVGTGIHDFINGFYWPIFIFLIVGSFERLGALSSTTALFSTLMAFVAGRIFDNRRARGGLSDEKMYWGAGVIVAIFESVKAAFGGLLGLFTIDALIKIVGSFHNIPYDGYLFTAGKKHTPLAFYAYREMTYSLSIALMALVVIVIAGLTSFWWIVFVCAGLGVLMSLVMAKES